MSVQDQSRVRLTVKPNQRRRRAEDCGELRKKGHEYEQGVFCWCWGTGGEKEGGWGAEGEVEEEEEGKEELRASTYW